MQRTDQESQTGNHRLLATASPSWRLWLLRFLVGGAFVAGLWMVRSAYRANQPVLFFGELGALLGLIAIGLRCEPPRMTRSGWMVWQRCAAAVFMLGLIETGYRLSDRLSPSTIK